MGVETWVGMLDRDMGTFVNASTYLYVFDDMLTRRR